MRFRAQNACRTGFGSSGGLLQGYNDIQSLLGPIFSAKMLQSHIGPDFRGHGRLVIVDIWDISASGRSCLLSRNGG